MPLTYNDWIARPSRNNWYGLQLRTRCELLDWVVSSGNIYKTNWPDAGKVLELTDVYQGSTKLTKGTNSSPPAGYWWQDRAAKPNVVYVQTTDSVNPYRKTMIGRFTDRYSSGTPVGKLTSDLNSVPWTPRIASDSVPTVEQALANPLFGTAVFGTITLTLINTDGYFDRAYNSWLWKDSECEFIHGDGGIELAYADHSRVTFVVVEAIVNEETIELTLENTLQVLDKPVLVKAFDIEDYPRMDVNLQGRWIPVFYGQGVIPFYPIDLVAGKFKGTNHALDSINAVYIDGRGVEYTADLANGELTLNNVVSGVTATPKAGGSVAAGNWFAAVAALVRQQGT